MVCVCLDMLLEISSRSTILCVLSVSKFWNIWDPIEYVWNLPIDWNILRFYRCKSKYNFLQIFSQRKIWHGQPGFIEPLDGMRNETIYNVRCETHNNLQDHCVLLPYLGTEKECRITRGIVYRILIICSRELVRVSPVHTGNFLTSFSRRAWHRDSPVCTHIKF